MDVHVCRYFTFFVQVAADEAGDEISSYFKRETTPKILLTTSDRCTGVSISFLSPARRGREILVAPGFCLASRFFCGLKNY